METLATTVRSRAIERLPAGLMDSHMASNIAGARDAGVAPRMRTADATGRDIVCSSVLRGRKLGLEAGGIVGRYHHWETGTIVDLLGEGGRDMAGVRI